jgi:PKD repeat protein
MKRPKLIPLLLFCAACLLFASCEEEPVASFTVSDTIVGTNQQLTFTSTSTDTDHCEWFFGDGSSATGTVVTHSYEQEGIYTVTLIAYTKSGRKFDDAYHQFIIVINPKNVTFNNSTFTPISIEVSGYGTQTIPVNGNVTFQVFSSSINFSASTTDTYSNGDPLALTINWSGTLDVPDQNNSFTLNVGTSFFFFYVINSSYYTVGPIYTNYGTGYQVTVNASLPNNGVKYHVGYHYARTNNQIRLYINATQYYYITLNTYPNVNNQSFTLTLTSKSVEIAEDKSNFVEIPDIAQVPLSNLIKINMVEIPEESIDLYPLTY